MIKTAFLTLVLACSVHAQPPLGATTSRPDNSELPGYPRFELDGKVGNLSSEAYAALESVFASGSRKSLTEAQAANLKAAVLKDGKIDDSEWELLEELAGFGFRITQVWPAEKGKPHLSVTTVSDSQEILLRTLYPKLDFQAAWAEGASGFVKILKVVEMYPSREPEAQAYLESVLDRAWQSSTAENAYKPFREEFSRYYGWCAPAPAKEQKRGKILLLESAQSVDKRNENRIPDILYTWLLKETI